MINLVGTTFSFQKQTLQITKVTAVDESLTKTLEALELSKKAPFYFSASPVLRSGKVSKTSALYLRFESGKFVKYL